ncbi:unnamed protein product [Lepeophtheirus salmonis]|uniref:(salmon louse) hypothetical protein n=1 Tax=Lepeophtheirus salmonis TaxID=72036 RepID=A0A7R8D167_LEPSM|nr:unnamed protein product [Lepeophtheirus salmonis]CAF2967001.1 unnamed protein product [Lepeophtheirus salmonis]
MVIRLFYYRTTGQLTAKKNGIGGPFETWPPGWETELEIPAHDDPMSCQYGLDLLVTERKTQKSTIKESKSPAVFRSINFISCYTEIGTNKTFNTRIIRKHLAYSVH